VSEKFFPVILPKFRLLLKFRDLLHAANVRHGTDGFTSPPKKGVLRIYINLPHKNIPSAETVFCTSGYVLFVTTMH